MNCTNYTENERLRNQLQTTNERNEVDDKLVRYVESDIAHHEADVVMKLEKLVTQASVGAYSRFRILLGPDRLLKIRCPARISQ